MSFGKKDKSKPTVKEQAAIDVKAETVEEVRYKQVKNFKIKYKLNDDGSFNNY